MYEPLGQNIERKWWAIIKTKKLATFLALIILVSLFAYMTKMPKTGDIYTKIPYNTVSTYEKPNISEIFQPNAETTVATVTTLGTTTVLFEKVQFDINSTDVMVFLHIQKTGGTTFGQHLVRDLLLRKNCYKPKPSLKRFNCLRPNSHVESWLFSRYTTGWKCGLHADWTSLNECVHEYFYDLESKRNYYYFTILREPVSRYLSEYAHVRRGATWRTAHLNCQSNQYPSPLCFTGENWMGVTLDEFISCRKNWAINRQTRMLADLRQINCTGEGMLPEDQDRIMLETAKKNLLSFTYFGLTEEQEKSRLMFEYMFDMKFKVQFQMNNLTLASQMQLPEDKRNEIRKINHLDAELYEFAREIFYKRWESLVARGLVRD